MTGRIYMANDEDKILPLPEMPEIDEQLSLDENDIYKELKLRGYNYRQALKHLKSKAKPGLKMFKNSIFPALLLLEKSKVHFLYYKKYC